MAFNGLASRTSENHLLHYDGSEQTYNYPKNIKKIRKSAFPLKVSNNGMPLQLKANRHHSNFQNQHEVNNFLLCNSVLYIFKFIDKRINLSFIFNFYIANHMQGMSQIAIRKRTILLTTCENKNKSLRQSYNAYKFVVTTNSPVRLLKNSRNITFYAKGEEICNVSLVSCKPQEPSCCKSMLIS